MSKPTTRWRISPAGWVLLSLGIVAEAASNALRAYGLGSHLERFTVHVGGHAVSLAGAILVLAALAVSAAQARAAWIALTPSGPARQRIVSGIAAILMLAISISAMATHILEAQRAKVTVESGERGSYDRAKAAYDKADRELASLASTRSIADVKAALDGAPVDRAVFARTKQCTDVTRDDSFKACKSILDLRQEMGRSIRKTELESTTRALREELAGMQRPEDVTTDEAIVSRVWAWIMGLGVVFLATFGSIIFAKVEVTPPPTANDNAPEGTVETAETGDDPPGGRRTFARNEALADILVLTQAGRPVPSQDWLKERWGLGSKGTVSKWMGEWEEQGLVERHQIGRCKQAQAA